MGDYRIKMNINIDDIKNGYEGTLVNLELDITDDEACSIDCMEKVLLRMDKDILRRAISEHFESVSKKKLKTM